MNDESKGTAINRAEQKLLAMAGIVGPPGAVDVRVLGDLYVGLAIREQTDFLAKFARDYLEEKR